MLRINQMPDVDVHIVSSCEPPSGVGELAPMAVGAAVANALSSVTGRRYRSLPVRHAWHFAAEFLGKQKTASTSCFLSCPRTSVDQNPRRPIERMFESWIGTELSLCPLQGGRCR